MIRWSKRFMLMLLVLGLLASSTQAAYTPELGRLSGERMLKLRILKGKSPDDPLALRDEITRAELVTILVRAHGQEANAALLNGAAAFPDTANHWASGYIAMAQALVQKAGGDSFGMPDGTFGPDAKLTPAQAVSFLMKFLGIKADPMKPWPANHLEVAVEKGLITPADAAMLAPIANDNATRGLVFYLADRALSTYDLGGGKTFYTKYVDTQPPTITLDTYPAKSTTERVTIAGTVEGAEMVVGPAGAISINPETGRFSVELTLEAGANRFEIVAIDLAGNKASVTVAIEGP